jgi:hypothetical protein
MRIEEGVPLSLCYLQNIRNIDESTLHNSLKSIVKYPSNVLGRAIAQAVSRWLPTAAARVRDRVCHVGFVVDKVALGQVFSEYFGFLCQSSFH